MRVHVRGFPANTVLPCYRDCSSSGNTMLVRYHVPVLGHTTYKCFPSVTLSEVCNIQVGLGLQTFERAQH